MSSHRTHYEALGIRDDANATVIKRAFRALALKLHPDVNASPDAHAKFADAQRAYSVLNDSATRAQYDAALASLRAMPADRPQGAMHFTWSNIADSGSRVAETDDELFEDLYSAFFQTRLPKPDAAQADKAERPAPRSRPRRRA